ncbi:MAG: TfoX/Sxy family protein [Candidatus Methylomirabilales bacterium]
MAFDQKLAARVRKRLGQRKGLAEKRMFGGLAFLLNGNMRVGVHGGELIVRLEPEQTDRALADPHTRVFDLSGGRPMKGWILVKPAGVADEASLRRWIGTGVAYATALPKK